MKTDTSEAGLERLIVADMVASGWIAGDSTDYDRDYAVDGAQLQAFINNMNATPKALLAEIRAVLRPPKSKKKKK